MGRSETTRSVAIGGRRPLSAEAELSMVVWARVAGSDSLYGKPALKPSLIPFKSMRLPFSLKYRLAPTFPRGELGYPRCCMIERRAITMRAVLTVGHGARDQLQLATDFPAPRAAPGEVVLKVAATAVNYHDIFTRRGMPGIRIPLPVIVGSDIAGVITELGRGVTGWGVGYRVLVDPVFRDWERHGMIGELNDIEVATGHARPAAPALLTDKRLGIRAIS